MANTVGNEKQNRLAFNATAYREFNLATVGYAVTKLPNSATSWSLNVIPIKTEAQRELS